MNTETIPEDITPLELPPDEFPIHLARCTDCGFSVRYRPTSGAAYLLMENTGRALGIGEHNRPTCPDGHGEMEIADDRLPIEQAIEQTAERLDTAAQRLPFPVPAFNYEGVLHAICVKRHEIAEYESTVEARKAALKLGKDRLDEANAQLGRMIDQFEQDERDRIAEIARREARAAAGHPDDTNLVRCAWELANPDLACPICAEPDMTAMKARDSAAHVDEVAALLELRDVTAVSSALEDIHIIVTADAVRPWSATDRAAVLAWAEAENSLTEKPADHQRPAILGTAHVAGSSTTSEREPGDTFQCCRECGARLVSVKTGDGVDLDPYPAGTLVGTDCPGAEKEPARYAKRGKKAKR